MTTEPPNNPAGQPIAQTGSESRDPKPPRLLIVDDEAPIRSGLARFFQSRGYETAVAHDADEAMAVVRSGATFSLAICDVRLPGISGLELVPMMQAVDRDIAVLLLTGDADLQGPIPPSTSSPIAQVVKPVELRELEQIVVRLLRQRSHLLGQRQIERLMLEEAALRADTQRRNAE